MPGIFGNKEKDKENYPTKAVSDYNKEHGIDKDIDTFSIPDMEIKIMGEIANSDILESTSTSDESNDNSTDSNNNDFIKDKEKYIKVEDQLSDEVFKNMGILNESFEATVHDVCRNLNHAENPLGFKLGQALNKVQPDRRSAKVNAFGLLLSYVDLMYSSIFSDYHPDDEIRQRAEQKLDNAFSKYRYLDAGGLGVIGDAIKPGDFDVPGLETNDRAKMDEFLDGFAEKSDNFNNSYYIAIKQYVKSPNGKNRETLNSVLDRHFKEYDKQFKEVERYFSDENVPKELNKIDKDWSKQRYNIEGLILFTEVDHADSERKFYASVLKYIDFRKKYSRIKHTEYSKPLEALTDQE